MMDRRRFLGQGLAGWGGLALAPAHAAEPGVGDREIVLGQSCVLSGPLGTALQGYNAGARLAFDEANARGGVNGRQLRVETLDDGLKPERAVENYRRLLDEHRVFAFFGGVGSGTVAAAAPLLKETGAPLVGNFALSDEARQQARGGAYFVRATYRREAEKIVQHLSTLGITKLGVAHLDNPGGEEVRQMVAQAQQRLAPSAPAPVAAAVRVDGSNVDSAIETLAQARPQAVIIFLSGPPVSRLMGGLADRGLAPVFYGLSVVAGEQVAAEMGRRLRSLAICQVVPLPWSTVDATTRTFQQLAEAARVPVSYTTFEGYLNALVLLEGLRRCGRDLSRAALHRTMSGLKMSLAGIDLDFTDGPTGSRFVELVQVLPGGRFVR